LCLHCRTPHPVASGLSVWRRAGWHRSGWRRGRRLQGGRSGRHTECGRADERQPDASHLRGVLVPRLADEIGWEFAKTSTATRRAGFDRRKLHYPAHGKQPLVVAGLAGRCARLCNSGTRSVHEQSGRPLPVSRLVFAAEPRRTVANAISSSL
jgi:hypothetical protein